MKKTRLILLSLILGLFISVYPFNIQKTEAAKASYDYEIVYQSPYPSTLPVNSSVNVYLDIKNTGSVNWYKKDLYGVRLGSGSIYGSNTQGRDYNSEFANNDWLSKNRPVSINKNIVKPGETARFQFNIKTPAKAGNYKAYFTPVVDGLTWMKDLGIFWEINTTDNSISKQSSEKQGVTKTENVNYSANLAQENNKNNFASAAVKLICWEKEGYSQQGSGTLIRNDTNTTGIPRYYVLTNRHVVRSEDGTVSKCSVYLYPDKGGVKFLEFTSNGFRDFDSGLDLAIIEPTVELISNVNSGKYSDLDKYSISSSKIKTRVFTNSYVDRRSTVIGYPKGNFVINNSGEILNSTFFKDDSGKYIEVTADLGNGVSGSIVLDSDGYTLGIMTGRNSRTGTGEVLDLGYALNNFKVNIF